MTSPEEGGYAISLGGGRRNEFTLNSVEAALAMQPVSIEDIDSAAEWLRNQHWSSWEAVGLDLETLRAALDPPPPDPLAP